MLSDFNFKTFYSTATDNIPENFYSLALKSSTKYDRVSGYFSSASLAYYAKGIEHLLVNSGKFRLIISHEISEKDYEQIVAGYKNRNKSILTELESRIDFSLLTNSQKKNLSNLSYLIEIGLVDIKIGFTHTGLFHAKYGMFKDDFGNIVYFSGSLNETEAAFTKNYEDITVISSWQSNEQELLDKSNYFEKLWREENNDGMIFVKSINEVIKSKLISFSQGKVIVEKNIFEDNAIVLYFDNGLRIINNLKTSLDLKQRSMKQIIRKGFSDERVEKFKDDLSYVDIKEIIKLFERYSSRTGEKLIVTDNVYQFINDSEFKIDSVAKRGLAIKNQDQIFDASLTEFVNIVNSEVTRPLYKIQSWVSFYQATMQRAANFSVPGSGKTSMVYGTFAYLSSSQINKIDKLVVIGPKNSFLAWKTEFKSVFGNKREMAVLDVHDEKFREEMFFKNINDYNLFLVNYESLEKYKEALNNVVDSRTMLVFDEVHKIKRVDSSRASISIDISKKTKYKYVLTGTPIPNTYQDTWNFLHILFENEFKEYFGIQLSALKNPDDFTIANFNKKLSPFFWRVTKTELNVPKENDDHIISVTANQTEQQIINLLWKKFSNQPFKLYIRLIQLSSNPQLLKDKISIDMYGDYGIEEDQEFVLSDDTPFYDKDELALIDSITSSTKFNECVKLAEHLINDSKVIVIWCIFIDTINQMKQALERKGIRVAVIYGGIDAKQREKTIVAFQNGEFDVLITNPHTLAESVSLHKIAHDAIYLEYSFNLTHMLQSRDRIHRLGLPENQETNYYYFVTEGQEGKRGTIDRKIYSRLLAKKDIMYEAIESELIKPEFTIDDKAEILQMMEEEIQK